MKQRNNLLLQLVLALGSVWIAAGASEPVISTQKLDFTVANDVFFVADRSASGIQTCLTFRITITNLGSASIPDLSIEHIEAYTKFLRNGKPCCTPAFYGGLEEDRPTNILFSGESHSYGWSVPITQTNWGSFSITQTNWFPSLFTVQWEYLGRRSRMVQVDMIKKLIKEVPENAKMAEPAGAHDGSPAAPGR